MSSASQIVPTAALTVVAALTLAACSSGSQADSDIQADTSAPAEIAAETVAAAQAEGEVVVYANSPDELWTALIPNSEEAYPGITISPELPDYAKPWPGVYAIAADPSIIVYSKAAVGDEAPESLGDVAALAPANQDKLTTYDIDSENGYAQMWTFAENREDAWDLYGELFPATRFELNGGSMTQKLAQGEYVAGDFQSGLVRGLLKPNAGRLASIGDFCAGQETRVRRPHHFGGASIARGRL